MDDLILRFKRGEEKAVEYLFKKYSTELLCFVKSYLHDEAKAKDVVQDSYVALWNNRSRLSDDSNLRSMLYTIARNRALNQIRDEHIFSDCESLAECNIKSIYYVESRISEEENMERLLIEMVDELPEKYREVFLKSRDQNMTYAKIADKLSISDKVVEKRMSKALLFFRERLKKEKIIYSIFYLFWV